MPPLALELHDHWSGWLANAAIWLAHRIFAHPATEDVAFVEASLYAWTFVIPGLALLCWAGTRRLERVPGPLQNVLEAVVWGLETFCRSIIGGPHWRDFVPYIGAIFIYIFALNVWGVVPGMQAATSTVNQTLALAACTFVMTHYAGFAYSGVRKYIMHFAGEPLWLAPLMFPIHVIGELARPLSLTMRLFGNIGGEEKAIAIFISLGLATGAYLPFHLPLSALAVFTSFIQALIFAVLSAVYIAGALPHEHHHEHAHEVAHAHEGKPVHSH